MNHSHGEEPASGPYDAPTETIDTVDLRQTSLSDASVAMVALVVQARERTMDRLRNAEEQAAAIVAAAEAEAAAIRQRASDEAALVFEEARTRIDAEVRAAEARVGGPLRPAHGTDPGRS